MRPVASLAHTIPICVAPDVRSVDTVTPDRWQDNFDLYRHYIGDVGVSHLAGYGLNLPLFEDKIPKCVAADLLSEVDAAFILHGLRHGFDLAVNHAKMLGRRVHKNYTSAYEHKEKVHNAILKRVVTGKTLRLGPFDGKSGDLPSGSGTVVPQGAVLKKYDTTSVRPISDHTKSQLNNSVDLTGLEHTLNTYNEISRALQPGYFMRIEDVDAAFPTLPLSPTVWRYMYIWWYDTERPLAEQDGPNTLYVHTFADFGSAPLPAIWDKFFRCVKAMALLDGVLTLPMPHFVDDSSIIGPSAEVTDAVAESLTAYMITLGVPFKSDKSRKAAVLQLVLGFWWDSTKRTRTLEDGKLALYLQHFREIANTRVVTLLSLQTLVGRMHRAIMTMPPGSNIFLARVLPLLSGLTLPWHRRRLSAGAREDILAVVAILECNMGRGYFSYDHMPWAPAVYTDAMKDGKRAGWGWCSLSGEFDYGVYGTSQSRNFIDALEGDAVLRAATVLGHTWRGKRVPFYIDSKSFQLSFVKGRSTAERLTVILRQLYALSVTLDCLFVPIWLSTDVNIGADALSRGDLVRFKEWAKDNAPACLSDDRCVHAGRWSSHCRHF